MNHWHNDMAEQRRQEIIAETEQIRLEKLALKSRLQYSGLFTRTMFNLPMDDLDGKQLRKRYEAPTVNCNNSPTGSFAR